MKRASGINRLLKGMGASLLSLYSFAHAGGIEIERPTERDILYGREKIEVYAPEASRVLFYLEPVKTPICEDRESPFECEFDAGEDFQPHTIRAVAYGQNSILGEDAVTTRGVPEPTRVVNRTLLVPVRLGGNSRSFPPVSCTYGNEECRIISAEKASESERKIYIDILVDLSKSTKTARKEITETLKYILGNVPENSVVNIYEFSVDYRKLEELENPEESLLSGAGRASCIYKNILKSMERLSSREGIRVLAVLSDGLDNCGPNGKPDMASAHLAENYAQDFKIMVYVYKTGGLSGGTQKQRESEGFFEGLALSTGGKEWKDTQGIAAFAKEFPETINSLWEVDINVKPQGIPKPKRLRLETNSSVLKYPEYVTAGNRREVLLNMLYSENPATRYRAVANLGEAKEARNLGLLFNIIKQESVPAINLAALKYLYETAELCLLHGTYKEQKESLKALERLTRIENASIFHPYEISLLETYLKTNPESNNKRMAVKILNNFYKHYIDILVSGAPDS